MPVVWLIDQFFKGSTGGAANLGGAEIRSARIQRDV